jgi:pimeloyl-ACP methyl ester carboxylesterase
LEAVEHPDEVAGVVLIDASHPQQYERWDALMTEDQRQQVRSTVAQFPYVDFESSLEEAAAEYGEFPALPLTVMSAAGIVPVAAAHRQRRIARSAARRWR